VDGLEQTYGTRLHVMRVDFNSSTGQELAARYQVRGYPTIVVIDRAGVARSTIIGVPTRERVEQAIKEAAPKNVSAAP
jgi:thioredoxin-related protein